MCIRDSRTITYADSTDTLSARIAGAAERSPLYPGQLYDLACLLYTSDAADDLLCVDLGGRRIIKKKKHNCDQLVH